MKPAWHSSSLKDQGMSQQGTGCCAAHGNSLEHSIISTSHAYSYELHDTLGIELVGNSPKLHTQLCLE